MGQSVYCRISQNFIVFMYVPLETPTDVIDHYYHYLSQEMDGDLTIEQITSLPSTMLNQDEITFLMTAINQYQKNCLMLEKIRLMDIGSLATFCMVLKSIDHKAHLGSVLLNGERILIISCSFADIWIHHKCKRTINHYDTKS